MPLKLRMPSASSPRTSPADAATTGPASAAAGSSAASRSAKGQERTVIEPNFPCLGSEAIIGAQADGPRPHPRVAAIRSEEHTSELQSLMRISYAVFCLKKKTKKHKTK